MTSTDLLLLGVNIDHVATLRQARGTRYPDPVQAAFEAEEAGADGITLHLREDRRHIQERDVRLIQQLCQTRVNLEMAVTDEMVDFALDLRPAHVCLVPEKRQELTTEGGLDLLALEARITAAVGRMQAVGIEVSLFIDADPAQIDAAVRCRAKAIELHTGHYAELPAGESSAELQRLQQAATQAHQLGLIVNAGHGLHYHNVEPIAAIAELNELNIGHAIIARALFTGLKQAVRDIKALMRNARRP
ncbi:MAG: pyridoxine 5'-phosphate synthase [Pseudomonadales bacterium]|jgi:pyridoxine 5-phosphate synthase|nr:pyridoxine 5'-phosphate synthase [Pseudomonadales bacterium]HMW83825.1 pyridoxine 5'-phosphate synthase [Pseudomonadales bacterium]HMZ92400.1 pyridoxine 5'-phosphate synthase [Pseudomonadales bacterium]HNI64561.1 pyridoxine 5'-phosphate synthase [Pseudomonadales bacterium]